MCGIIGYIYSGEEVSDYITDANLISGLSRMQHRGYDSWGICLAKENGKGFYCYKSTEKMTEYLPDTKIMQTSPAVIKCINEIQKEKIKSNFGIAHTRWATHGKISERNTHPHFSCDKNIAVVHNGIVENFEELKKELELKGHIFQSETDTEVIPHLIEEYCKTHDVKDAFEKAISRIQGAYAIVAICLPQKSLFAAKKDNPLIISIDKDQILVSSDIIPVSGMYDRLIRMQDGDIAFLNKEGIKIKNNGEDIIRKPTKLNLLNWWQISADPLGDELTEQEIMHQKRSMKSCLEQNDDLLLKITEKIKKSKQIILTGSGSSYNAAVLGQCLFRKLGLPAIAVPLQTCKNLKNRQMKKLS
jgi:glucosamine--fructose-6-phosphate aminotransferase (isomerizing)